MRVTVLRCDHRNFLLPAQYLIKYSEGTDFSHYAILINGFVIDSTTHGVRVTTIHQFLKKYHIRSEEVFNLEINTQHLLGWTRDMIGVGYGLTQNIFIFLRRKGWIKELPRFATNEINCAEFVMLFMDRFNPRRPMEINVGLIEVESYLKRVKDA